MATAVIVRSSLSISPRADQEACEIISPETATTVTACNHPENSNPKRYCVELKKLAGFTINSSNLAHSRFADSRANDCRPNFQTAQLVLWQFANGPFAAGSTLVSLGL